jgi:cAMP phosphodiesterase
MKLRLLPSTFETDGTASIRQHYACFVVDGSIAFDAGSLANGVSDAERTSIRDVVLTHAHLDHIAGLPLFIDDLFPILTEPVRVHASKEVIDTLEAHIFNWSVYPRFSELTNQYGPVIEYHEVQTGKSFTIGSTSILAVPVNHRVPATGFLIESKNARIAISGDTAEMDVFWGIVNNCGKLNALLIECAFPNEFEDLSKVSHHLTPSKLKAELSKFNADVDNVYVINLKPAYRAAIVSQLEEIRDARLKVLEVGRLYEF